MTTVESVLQQLVDRTAIRDKLYALARAMDTRDWDLLAQCYTPDAQGDFATGPISGRQGILTAARGFLNRLDTTQHTINNIEITFDGDRATTHSTFIAQHVRRSASFAGHYLIGGMYDDQWEKPDSGWKICARRITGLWADGDPDVLAGSLSAS